MILHYVGFYKPTKITRKLITGYKWNPMSGSWNKAYSLYLFGFTFVVYYDKTQPSPGKG